MDDHRRVCTISRQSTAVTTEGRLKAADGPMGLASPGNNCYSQPFAVHSLWTCVLYTKMCGLCSMQRTIVQVLHLNIWLS
jgi:hypothetical protein